MICKKCGAELKTNVKFCNKCGAKITLEEPVKVDIDEVQVKSPVKENNEMQMQDQVAVKEDGNRGNDIVENSQIENPENKIKVEGVETTESATLTSRIIEPEIRNMDYGNATSSVQPEMTSKQSEANNNTQMKKKSKFVAGLLAIFLGFFGVHWFYLRKPMRGIIYLIAYLVFPFVWLLYIVEGLFFMFCKEDNFHSYINWGSSRK